MIAINLQAALTAEGIQTGIHYPVPAHLQPAYSDLGYGPGSFPQAEKAAAGDFPAAVPGTDRKIRSTASPKR